MGKKAAKATRKFAASGQLKKTIQQRRKHQDIRRKAERRKGTKKGGATFRHAGDDENEAFTTGGDGEDDNFTDGEDDENDFFKDGGDDEDESMASAAGSGDEDVLVPNASGSRKSVLKTTYLALVRVCKSTTAYSLPSINSMKNSASELYTTDHSSAYQHAFGYIRQLAILLRNSLKTKSKEAFKQVYNWQYVHCIDFWTIVLARACDQEPERGNPSELRPLIYPLIQVALGAIRLIPNARSYPYHLHLTRSLLHLAQHSRTYIPLAPVLLPMLVTPLTQSAKGGSLKPLDFETTLRAPQQYVKTRVYAEGLVEEAAFWLAEYLASPPVHGSVGFPEVIVPIVGAMRHAVKATQKGKGKGKGKEVGIVKALVERIEESGKWVEERRRGISFSPGKLAEVEQWEAGVKVEETPLGKYVRVLRKSKEKKQRLIQKARDGEDEILEN